MTANHVDCSFSNLLKEWEEKKKEENRSDSLYQWCRDKLFAGRLADACRDHVEKGSWCEHGNHLLERWNRGSPEGEAIENLLESPHRNISGHHLQMVRAHLSITRYVTKRSKSRKNAIQWASGAFPDKLSSESEKKHLNATPYGPAFFRSLVTFLHSTPNLSEDCIPDVEDTESTSALFPVALEHETGSRGDPIVGQLQIYPVKRETDSVFLHPSLAFLDMDKEFRSTFDQAHRLVEGLSRGACVCVEPWSEGKSLSGLTLAGPSAGGALYLGLRSMAEKKDLERDLLTSIGLGTDPDGMPDGNCEPVGLVREKGSKLPQKGFRRLLVAEEQDVEGLERHISDLEVLQAREVEEAWEHATGRLYNLQKYLRHVEEKAQETTHFTSQDMGQIREPVRVSLENFARGRAGRSKTQVFPKDLEKRKTPHRNRAENSGSTVQDGGRGEEDSENRGKTHETFVWDEDIVGSGLERKVVLGGPGSGKTWLVRWEAQRLAREALGRLRRSGFPDEVQIPIRLRLSNIGKTISEKGCSFSEAVVECFSEKKISHGNQSAQAPSELLTELIDEKIGTKKVWLLLDALSEAQHAGYRDTVVEGIRSFLQNNPDSRLLLASRETRYDSALSDIIRRDRNGQEMKLLPFDYDQIKEFVHKYFSKEKADTFLNRLDSSPQIRGMAESPLLLTFLCRIFGDMGSSTLQSISRAQVYERTLNEILSALWHETEQTSLNPDKRQARMYELSAMAFTLFVQGEIHISQRKLDEAIRFGYSRKWDERPGEEKTIERREEYISKPGVLTSTGGKESVGSYRFIHLTIQEYLTARWMALQVNDNGWNTGIDIENGRTLEISTIVDRKAWSPRWQQVIPLMAGQLEDPAPLLDLLADRERDDVFRRRLALAARCLGEVMEQKA